MPAACMKSLPKVRTSSFKVFGAQLAELNKFFVTLARPGCQVRTGRFRADLRRCWQAIATANNAYDSMTKAAKLGFRLAEANVAAATKAPAKTTRARKAS